MERRKLRQRKKKKILEGKFKQRLSQEKHFFPRILVNRPRLFTRHCYRASERASEPANKTEHAVFSSACLKRKEKPFPRREDDFLSRPMEQTFFSIPFHLTVYSIVRTDTAFSTSVSSKTTLSRTGYSRTWRDRGLECGRRKRNKMESVR